MSNLNIWLVWKWYVKFVIQKIKVVSSGEKGPVLDGKSEF